MTIRVLAIGKKHESWVTEGIDRYEKRMKKPFDLKWQTAAAFIARGRFGAYRGIGAHPVQGGNPGLPDPAR